MGQCGSYSGTHEGTGGLERTRSESRNMEHVCSAEDCSGVITRGADTIQLLRGTCHMGYITPAFSSVMLEWHAHCFHEFPLIPQNIKKAPYLCRECFQRIAHGDEVTCFVLGAATDGDYSVSERRGYDVYSIAHLRCIGPVAQMDSAPVS